MKNILKIFYTIAVIFYLFLSTQDIKAQWIPVGGPISAGSMIVSGTNLVANNYQNGVFSVMRTDGSDNNWILISNNGLPASNGYSLFFSGADLFVGTSGLGIFKSSNQGNTWINAGQMINFTVFAFAKSGSDIYAVSKNNNPLPYNRYFLNSTDNGASWNAFEFDFISNDVISLAVSETNIFVGTNGFGAYRSTNYGGNWTQVNNGLMSNLVACFAVTPTYLFAGTYNGIFKTTNNGANWISVNNGLTNLIIRSIAFSGENLFVTTFDGIFASSDNGVNWIPINTGLTNLNTSVVVILGNNLYISTRGDGVWKRPLSEIISVQSLSSKIPLLFKLEQSYPNPFNPRTNIKFDIPKKSFVKLVIYNSLGKEIDKLVNEELNVGSYQADWNAGGYPSGVYFYRMETKDFVQTRSMVFLK